MSYQDIITTIENRIAVIQINRPDKLNAFRTQTLVELSDAVKTASDEKSVRVILLSGAGDMAFCVGGDIDEMSEFNEESGKKFVNLLWDVANTLLNCSKPMIAKVNGYCIGGGNELQMFCDLTIASSKSVFAQTGALVGSAPLWGGTQILPLLIGLKKSKEMAFLCKKYSASDALAMGLINQVIEESELNEATLALCQELMGKSPQSLMLIKKAFHQPILAQLKTDLDLLQTIYGSPELVEGMKAFKEKRKARF